MEIKSKEIVMVDPSLLVPNKDNTNRHSIEQLERLEKIIKHQGFRDPITVSNRSGFVVCGHARLEVALKLKMEKVPVLYQDFASEAEEYAHLNASNEIARWAELDKQAVYEKLELFDDFDIEFLGIEDISLFDFQEDNEEEIDINKETPQKYILKVELPNEMEMHDLKDDLISKGYNVRAEGEK